MFILDVTDSPKVLWECKHCAKMNEDDLVKFFSAHEMKKGLVCVHCKNEFYVGIKLLDTRSPTLRAPARSAIELLRTIRNAGDVEMSDFSNEFWQEVDAVLKTAGGR